MRKGGVVNENRINQLPQALVLKILSSLPTKTVTSTSVLSKQWRSLWKMVPNLEFDSTDHKSENHAFSEIVCKSFLSSKAPVVDRFRLRFGLDKISPMDIGLWIGLAFARNLRELVLEYIPNQETFVFPSSFCTCNTLETLKLKLLIMVDISSPVFMKSLKTLQLIFVSYKDDASIRNLLSGCPSLENLVVDRGDDCGVQTFTIDVPSLQRLSIYDSNCCEDFLGYMINTPSLKYLLIEELQCQAFCINAPELVDAGISNVSTIVTEKLLGSLTSVKRLAFDSSPFEITYPTGSIFSQLINLYINIDQPQWWNLLTITLENSPNLQVLTIADLCSHDGVISEKWNEPKHVPECLLSHLRTFEWKRYDWGRKEMASYILRNARQLKKATFSTNPIESEEVGKLEERRKMLNELEIVVRGSHSCHLLFEFDSTPLVESECSPF